MNPRTVDDVLKDFKGRRVGIIKALTKNVDLFYNLCDPKHPNLCLYGLPNQQWEVKSAPPRPSSEIPEPRSGINLVRDTMSKEKWLSMVALHSDAWLHACASYFSSKHNYDRADRKRLFNKISDLSPISELIMGGTRSRKSGNAQNDGLPDELVVDILTRLPVKALLRYKLVCKKWRSLINDPNFVLAHLKSYKNNIVGSQLFVRESPIIRRIKSQQYSIRRSDTYKNIINVKSSDDMIFCDIVGYINGLVLITNGRPNFKQIILWNPSINKSIKINCDPMLKEMREATYLEIGLGFNESINDYRVVVFTYPEAQHTHFYNNKFDVGSSYRAIIPGLVHVYTLSTNSWTTKLGVHPPSRWLVGPQVCVNGAIHWTGFGPFGPNVNDDSWLTLNNYKYIVSFDVEKEVFDYMEWPSDIEPITERPDLIVIDGCLAIMYTHSYHKDIWVMKEYGNSNSWSKCYTNTLQYSTLLHFKNNGELLFGVVDNGIKSYDVKRKSVRDLAKTYCRRSTYTIFTHLQSLVLSSI